MEPGDINQELTMTRTQIASDIANLEARAPSRFATFNNDRVTRLAELRALLATMPEAAAPAAEDAGLARFLDQQRRAERTQRATERRGY